MSSRIFCASALASSRIADASLRASAMTPGTLLGFLQPPGRLVRAPHDLARLGRAGVNAFLIGESLMRRQDVTEATRAILNRAAAAEY